MNYEEVRIPTLEGRLAARVYGVSGGAPLPVVILCHGFCGIQELLLPPFAEAFAAAGYIAVTFDYRGFGASDGERGRLLPQGQVVDVLAVIEWVRDQSRFDSERIALWGTSLGACHVVSVASRFASLKCLLLQMPFADGESLLTGPMSVREKHSFVALLEKMQSRKDSLGKDPFLPIPQIMTDPQSLAFFAHCKTLYPQMDIRIPFLTVREIFHYKPVHVAPHVRQPTLVLAASADRVNPPAQALQLYHALGGEKRFQLVEGVGHYELYEGDAFFVALSEQLHWLQRFL